MIVYAEDILEDYHFCCIDDYGVPVYSHKFVNGVFVWLTDVSFEKRPPTSKELEKQKNQKLFLQQRNYFDRGCNTCVFLERVHSEKTKNQNGFLFGICKSTPKPSRASPIYIATDYLSDPNSVMFHPEDPMHMDCYTSRYLIIE